MALYARVTPPSFVLTNSYLCVACSLLWCLLPSLATCCIWSTTVCHSLSALCCVRSAFSPCYVCCALSALCYMLHVSFALQFAPVSAHLRAPRRGWVKQKKDIVPWKSEQHSKFKKIQVVVRFLDTFAVLRAPFPTASHLSPPSLTVSDGPLYLSGRERPTSRRGSTRRGSRRKPAPQPLQWHQHRRRRRRPPAIPTVTPTRTRRRPTKGPRGRARRKRRRGRK